MSIRAIHDQLRMLERGPLHTGGFPTPSIRHWIVSPIGEGAEEVNRPDGQEVEGYRIKDFEIQRICNEQQFGSGQPALPGRPVRALGRPVGDHAADHRHRAAPHAADRGHRARPRPGRTGSSPAARRPRTKTVAKSVKFWETRTVKLPLVETNEVVRLAVRAPLTWFPPLLDYLGGKLSLPEPFGLRHAWADKPWRHRFMADDAHARGHPGTAGRCTRPPCRSWRRTAWTPSTSTTAR